MPPVADDRAVEEALREANRSATIRRWLIAFVALGVVLRLWQYFANTAIWLDEVAVVRNILDRSLWALLTSPLAYEQTAPKGFLVAEKIAVSVFGSSDYVLRLFPLLSSLIALVVFWRIVAHWLRGSAGVVALALFATAPPYVAFGSQVKPYSFDVAVALLLLWLALDLRSPSGWRGLLVGIAGAVLVWFSQPSVLVACALSVTLILFELSRRREARGWQPWVLALTQGLWIASALASSLVARASMTAATQEYITDIGSQGFRQFRFQVSSRRYGLGINLRGS